MHAAAFILLSAATIWTLAYIPPLAPFVGAALCAFVAANRHRDLADEVFVLAIFILVLLGVWAAGMKIWHWLF